jgi:hypothetical protein
VTGTNWVCWAGKDVQVVGREQYRLGVSVSGSLQLHLGGAMEGGGGTLGVGMGEWGGGDASEFGV